MPQLEIDRTRSIFYRDDNPSGNPCAVLLHGLGVTGDSWALQIPALVRTGFRVITPDMRGCGKSGYNSGPTDIATLSRDVRYLIHALNLAPVHLIGISMGGVITLQTLLDDPHAIDRAVLINSFAYLRPESVKSWLYFISRFTIISLFGLPAQVRIVSRSLFPSPDQEYLREAFTNELLSANPKAYRKMIRALYRYDVRLRLSEIQIPILIVSGEKDTTVPISIQSKLTLGIHNSKHIIIPDAGHAVIVEKPDQMNTTLIEFLLS